jgi:serine/threonine protein kinase
VAIKVIDVENAEDEVDDIIQEIAILSGMSSPYVTKYYGSYMRGTDLWIIMEFCSGGSCADLMKPGQLAEAEIAVILKELLMGLEYLHADNKLHRDIKGECQFNAGLDMVAEYCSCQHPGQRQWPGEACRLWCIGPIVGHHDQEEYICRHAVLDGSRSH